MIAHARELPRPEPQPEREKPLVIISVGSKLAEAAARAIREDGAEQLTYDSERFAELRGKSAEGNGVFVVQVRYEDVGATVALDFKLKGYDTILYNNSGGELSEQGTDIGGGYPGLGNTGPRRF